MAYTDNFPYSKITKKMIDYLPSWMTIRNKDSVGSQFVNAFGIEFENVEAYLADMLNNQFISTADATAIDYVYKFDIASVLTEINWVTLKFTAQLNDGSDAFDVPEVSNYEEFYLSESIVCMIDYDNNICYIRRPSDVLLKYEHVHVDAYDDDGNGGGITFTEFAVHHIWNALDEYGLLLGVPRLFKEDNTSYKVRLQTVFQKRGGPTTEGLKDGISRLLGVTTNEINLGLFDIKEMANTAFSKSLLNDDGTASDTLKKYARIINDQIANTWDHMTWDRAYWKALDDTKLGFDYLPHVWDAPTVGWLTNDFQSGVGNDLDLFVKAPTNDSDTQNFNYLIGARGIVNNDQTIYPQHTFSYKVIGRGTKLSTTATLEQFKYTVVAGLVHNLVSGTESLVKVNAYRQYEPETVVEFDGGTLSAEVEAVSSNLISSPSGTEGEYRDKLMVTATLDGSNNLTPSLDTLTMVWKDTSDVDHTVTISDFGTLPTEVTHEDKTNTVLTGTSIELGHGTFEQVVDTTDDWENGEMINCKVVSGTLKLNL